MSKERRKMSREMLFTMIGQIMDAGMDAIEKGQELLFMNGLLGEGKDFVLLFYPPGQSPPDDWSDNLPWRRA